MNNKYINDALIGNGKMLASFSKQGELLRIAYPTIDYKQNIDFFHVGIKINDSAIIYLHDDINNHYEQSYIENTNILTTNIENTYFNINIKQIDFVTIKKDILMKQYIFKNNNTIDMDINFLIHSEFISSTNNQVSARIFNDALLQYDYENTFAIFSNEIISTKQLHNTKDNIRRGEIYGKDYIGITKDSSISYNLGTLKPGEEKKICIYIYAKENDKSNSFEDIANEIDKLKKIDIEKEYNDVKKYWEAYVEKYYSLKRKDYNEKVYKIYKRTILLFPLLTNKETGGVIAGMEIDEKKEMCGGYRILLDKRCKLYSKSNRFIRYAYRSREVL